MYTLRDFTKTPADITKSIEKVAAMGYKAIQASAMGSIEASELLKVCEDNGVTLCSTHENSDLIRQEPEKVVEMLAALNCKLTAYPYPAGVDFKSSESVGELIKDLEKATQVLAKAGQILTYHNHHHEFQKIDGKTILDTIYDESSIQGELDSFWVQRGGGNTEDYCRKLKGRLPMIHLKDYKLTDDLDADFAEIGNGTLNFKSIIAAAEAAGCEWFIVEQDTCPGDPFDSLKQSFDYVSAHLVS